MKRISILFFVVFCLGIGAGRAQYTVLHNFNDTAGGFPQGSLIISGDRLYGMTTFGGAHDSGCVFSIDTNGNNYKDLFDLGGRKGAHPGGSLIISAGHLYGMTYGGGAHTYGCIFSIDTDGSGYKDLYDFIGYPTDGARPEGSLILSGNILYGMTTAGSIINNGTIFTIHTDGTGYKVLVIFGGGNPPYGETPNGDLKLSGNRFYGMTSLGGPLGYGVIFSVDTNGNGYKTLLQFNKTNGSFPWGALTLSGGKLFGMSEHGASNDSGCIFSMDTTGARYKDIFDFNKASGCLANGSLLLSGNILYGLAQQGGVNGYGVFFSIDTGGNGYKHVVDFNKMNYPAGQYPNGSLTLAGNNFYGMTNFGGFYEDGLVFSFKDTSIITSINRLSFTRNKLTVFPNPSTGIFTIHFAGAQNIEPKNIEIYNVLGERVETQCIASPQITINLTHQPSGVYFYRVVDENGGLVSEGKLIIQK